MNVDVGATPGRCTGLTRSGEPCKNYALTGSTLCRVHRLPGATLVEPTPSATSIDTSPEAQEEDAPPVATSSEPTIEALNHDLKVEVESLARRMHDSDPDYSPPPFSAMSLLGLVQDSISRLAPVGARPLIVKTIDTISSDLLDLDFWKGIWYVLNYSIKSQTDMVKRRFTGEFETDDWGLDMEFLGIVQPFFTFMYRKYWRVEVSGMENVPNAGRALLTVNHSGQLPWDGAMLGMAVLLDHPSQRLVRTLYASWFPTLPFFSATLTKLGQALATVDNGTRLLEDDQLVAVFPEGYKGVGKLFKERYHLARFGRGGFVRMALRAGAPIIPVSVVGAEETYVSLHKSPTLAKLIGFPYFPLSLTFPWFGLLGFVPLPTKWYIDFGEPIPLTEHGPEAADNIVLVSRLTDQVRNIVQGMIYDRLSKRRSVFLG